MVPNTETWFQLYTTSNENSNITDIKDADTVQCPTGCECKSATKCHWSTNAINILSDLQASNPLWKFHSSRFFKQICDKKNRQVCCCGPDQVSPEKCKSRNVLNYSTTLFFLADF